MTNNNTSALVELAERCEAAGGADRELDALIAAALRTGTEHSWAFNYPEWEGRADGRVYLESGGPSFAAKLYTGSLDAALTLVPEDMRDEIEITTLYQVARVTINMNHGPDGGPFYGSNVCNSIPLAICAAALRARAQQGEG